MCGDDIGRNECTHQCWFVHIDADLFARAQYRSIKDEWWGVPEVFDRADVIEVMKQLHATRFHALMSEIQERHRIDVDCRRTDRSQPLFAGAATDEKMDDEKGAHMRYSMISPQMCDIGAQAPTNEHIERLGTILLTYNFYEKELGSYLPLIPRVRAL